MKEIFVPYEIAIKLKEIGFNKHCVAYYRWGFNLQITVAIHNYNGNETEDNNLSAPTWEQVFKWFREKGVYLEIMITDLGFRGNIITCDEEGIKEDSYLKVNETYEQAREKVVLEMIEIYKENKFQPKVVQNINNNGTAKKKLRKKKFKNETPRTQPTNRLRAVVSLPISEGYHFGSSQWWKSQ